MAKTASKTKPKKPVLSIVSKPAATAVPATTATARGKRKAPVRKVLNLAGTVRAQAVTVAEADVTDEIAKGGPAFGTFLKSVGLAVAESQKALDETLVATAKSLSETKIEVIAVFEQVLQDSDGQMTQGNVHIQSLPLINYLMPTAYSFSRVYLQADMKVSEFNGANGFNIKGSSQSIGASARASYGLIGGFGASGSASFAQSSFSRSGEVSVAQDAAAGSLHMEATLEPRTDVQLPRPFVVQKGPRIQVRIDSSTPITGTGTPVPPATTVPNIGRQIVLVATLLKSDGTANSSKSLDVTVSEPQFNRDPVSATDTNGETRIIIKNEWGAGGAPGGQEPARKSALVRVAFGLATQTIGISL